MPRKTDNDVWDKFLGRNPCKGDGDSHSTAHAGKTILLAGAGGSIGSSLAMRLTELEPRLLLLLDSSEQNLYQIETELSGFASAAPHVSILGDIADRALLDEIFAHHQPQIVYHAAAFKHVPLMEANPLAAIRNNTLGTYALANAVVKHQVQQLIMISTDKAVDPASVMGVSKRLAELILAALGGEITKMNSIRLGNVLGSQGSVGLLFLQQISRGGPVTVTHPEVSRYFLTLSAAVELVLTGASLDSGIWVPEVGPPRKVLDLAQHLIGDAGLTPGRDVPITFIGLRPGEKMMEQLVSARESTDTVAIGGLHRVTGVQLGLNDVEAIIVELGEIVRRRNLPALLQTLCRVIPEYQPSPTLLEQAAELGTKANRA